MRLPRWERRLNDYLLEQEGRSFEYGKLDCAMFACGAIEAVTGMDVAKEFRGKYADKRSAAKVILQYRHSLIDLARKVALEVGFQEINPLLAHRGDVVAVPTVKGTALGVVGLDGSVFVLGVSGLTRTKLRDCVTGWGVR